MVDIVYLPIEDAAHYENVPYHTIYRKIMRNSDSYEIKKEPAPNGGKDRVYVSLNSLSAKARRAYQAEHDPERESKEYIIKKHTTEPPWYLTEDYFAYLDKYRNHFERAADLNKEIIAYMERWNDCESRNEKRELALEYAKRNQMSERSFYRYVERYKEASAWALQREMEDGANHHYLTILALCPEPREKFRFPSLSPEMKAFIENKRFDKTLAKNLISTAVIYDLFIKEARSKGWPEVSYHTVRAYVRYIVKKHKSAEKMVRSGERDWKRDMMPKGRRDTKSLKVMEWVVGDVHTFDCWVKIVLKNGKEQAVKPCLVGWLDVRSRYLVGHTICYIPDSLEIRKSLIHMMYPKKDENMISEGLPQNLLIDNGKEYTAESLTGRKRVERVYMQDEAKGFYREIGIENEYRALPYQPWTKSHKERFFRTVCERFSKLQLSYTGTLTGSKTAAKVKKDIKGMLEKGELKSIEQFAAEFQEWLNNDYHVRQHKGLKEQGDEWHTPIEVYQNAERYIKAAPPRDFTDSQLLDRETATVYNTGIQRNGHHYWNSTLLNYIGEKVEIRYDRRNVVSLQVYDLTTRDKICEAVCEELLQFGEVDKKKLESHIRKQRKAQRETMEDLEYLQLPYYERVDLSNDRPSIGPELKDGNPDVVSLPQNQEYRQEKSRRKSQENRKPAVENDYYQKRAIAALEKLKNIQ